MPSFRDSDLIDGVSSLDHYHGKVFKITDEAGMPSVTCRNVGHTQQQFDWDCGLSCVLMALDAADECDAKDSILENLEEICRNEGFGHSTWTIDLCYLLKHYAPRLAFSYTTITLGVDPSYMNQVFYNKILKRDSERVQDRFEQAKAQGVTVLEQRVPIEDIVQHINDAGTCIVLTNANLLSCETCSHFNLSGSGDNTCNTSCFLLRTCGSSAYQGHYVLAVGFDIPKRKIYYRNPTLRDRVCKMSFERFDEARNSYGTDEDLIFVAAVNEE